MYIREIRINKFRHIEGVELGPFGQPSQNCDLVVLAGPNAGGKSSVLELVGYALSATWSLSWKLSRSFPNASFEVAIALTSKERELVREYASASDTNYPSDAIVHISDGGVYYRAFNFEEGQYSKSPSLYNQIHALVTDALRNHYRRSLGFFLKSDRYYPSRKFQRERLFAFSEMMTTDYRWGLAYNTSELQYTDMYEFLVQQRYHYFQKLGLYEHNLNTGRVVGDRPSDPLRPYDELLQGLFPGYRFAETDEDVPTDLFVHLPSGDVVPFGDLSSGEKEVFFVLSSCLRQDVTDAIILIDEPELHLHPEFARLLVRTMQRVRPGNQIWLATHNPEIIDEAGRDRVTYLARDPATYKCVKIDAVDETAEMRQLKNLFGYSGYIGIAKSLVFVEGLDSSSDRKMFSTLVRQHASEVKFIPCGSVTNLYRVNQAVLSILESGIGWAEFYMIRDRDYLLPQHVKEYAEHRSGRLYVLKRHQIENYLLNPDAIAEVQTDIFGRSTTPSRVRQMLHKAALRIAGEVLRDMISYRLNLLCRPQDFSLGNTMQGQHLIDAEGKWDEDKISDLLGQVTVKADGVVKDLTAHMTSESIGQLVGDCQQEVRDALITEPGWMHLFPGRRLLEEYCKLEELGQAPIALQNSIIKELAIREEWVPDELSEVMKVITEGGRFAHAEV